MPFPAAIRPLPLTLLLLIASSTPARVQAPEGGAGLPAAEMETLRRVAERYRGASSMWLEGTIEARIQSGDNDQITDATFRLAFAPGGKMRDELVHPQAGMTRVSNGTDAWIYAAALRQYTQETQIPLPDSLAIAAMGARGGMAGVVLATFRGLDRGVVSVKALPEETLPLAGDLRRCQVLEVVHQSGSAGPSMPNTPRTFWIDKERHIVLQQRTIVRSRARDVSVEQTETLRYTRATVGGAVPESVFAFRPPAGARKVDQFERPGMTNLTGKAASDFTLPDLRGQKHSLKSQIGKVVMLDFWASWCGPCRVQMPMVEKLHDEFKDKGLVVYAINQGESAETARRYLTKNQYKATTLLDQKSEVGRTYDVNGIPTLVIIGRDGKVSAHYVGVRTESVLRDALKRAGL